MYSLPKTVGGITRRLTGRSSIEVEVLERASDEENRAERVYGDDPEALGGYLVLPETFGVLASGLRLDLRGGVAFCRAVVSGFDAAFDLVFELLSPAFELSHRLPARASQRGEFVRAEKQHGDKEDDQEFGAARKAELQR